MKTNKVDKSKRTAVEFIRDMEDTQNVMESIANQTATEQKALMESIIDNEDYTDEEGVFDMGSMLDVSIADEESNQPRYYNSPVEELTDADKNLIIDEFTKMIKDSHETVIDFSDIGPVATVIQDRFGFKQDVEGFLRDTVQKASDWQQSQKIAVDETTDTAGEEIVGEQTVPVDETGGPTDIKPDQEGITDGEPALEPMAEELPVAPFEEPVVEPVIEEIPTEDPLAVEEPVVDGGEGELGLDDVAGALDDVAVDGDVTDEIADEPVIDDAPEAIEGDEGSDEIVEDVVEDITDDSDEDKSEDEGKPLTESDKAPSLDAKLEAIKSKIDGADAIDTLVEAATVSLEKEKSVDAQLEAIRSEIVNSEVTPVVENIDEINKDDISDADTAVISEIDNDPKAKQMALADIKKQLGDDLADIEMLGESTEESKLEELDKKVSAQLEAISNGYHKKEDAKLEAIEVEKKLDAQLEAISNGYHKKEDAKLEAIKVEKKLDAQLEAIADRYKKDLTAKLEAEQKEAEVDSKLSGLIESYQNTQKSNLEARKATKAKIEQLSK